MSAVDLFRHFKPPGPVAAAFIADRTSKVRGLLGPVGGGKTVTCIFDVLANASQMPVCRDGRIHHRHVVVGMTYGQIERNLYPTWFHWLPKHGDSFIEAEWEGGGGRFGRQLIKFATVRNGRQVPIDLEVIFAAVGEQSVEAFVRGFEPTSAHCYEVDQLPPNIVSNMLGRFGRYPNADMLGRQPDYRTYLVADYNAPDIDNWTVKFFDDDPGEGVRLYRQPSGLSPKAENLQNLPKGYYQGLAATNRSNKRWVTRFIEVRYGPSDAGDPVYGDEYSDEMHLSAEPIQTIKGRGVYLGFDQGLRHPAMVVVQQAPSGQFRVLAECVPGRMNARRFAERCRQTLAEVAPGETVLGAWADPAGFDGADTEAGDFAWAEIVAGELNIAIEPAPTNEPDARMTAVRDELTFLIDAGTPGLVLSRGATPMLRKGFVSHYMYDRRPVEKQQVRLPIKNLYSNPHDALQYILLGIKGLYGVIAGKRVTRAARRDADDDCVTLDTPVVLA